MGKLKTNLHKIFDGAYKVGIVEDCNFRDSGNYFARIHWVNDVKFKDSWFADPFIIEKSPSSISLFVEEFQFSRNKGRLSLIKVDSEDYRLLEVIPILDLDTHLSFPYPIWYKDELYVCPENNAANEVSIYRFDGSKLTDKVKLLTGKFVDTQIIERDGKFFLFTSRAREGLNGGAKEVEVYSSNDLFGPYNLINIIKNERIEERGAGLLFHSNEGIIRPAQNCNEKYGQGIVFYNIDIKDNGEVSQTEIGRIDADESFKNGLCFHTFSVYDGLTAVDGFDYISRKIGKINPQIYKMKNILNKWLKK